MGKNYSSSLIIKTTIRGEDHEQFYGYSSINLIELQMAIIKKYVSFFTSPTDRVLFQLKGSRPNKDFIKSMLEAFVVVSGGFDHFACFYEFNDDFKITFELRATKTVMPDDYEGFELLLK